MMKIEIRTASISYAKSKAKSTYHREQEIKRQLDHFSLVTLIKCYKNMTTLKRNLHQFTRIKENKLCSGQSVAGWRMENVRPNISLIWKNEIITKTIDELRLLDDSITNDEKLILNHIEVYYKDLLTSENTFSDDAMTILSKI